MFNPQIRKQVYNGLLESERPVRYDSKMAEKYSCAFTSAQDLPSSYPCL